MVSLDVIVKKECWKVPQLKRKYMARMLVFIQAIWLMGSQNSFVNKKFMLIVALTKQGK
jgi:hypothetical protein